VPFCPNPFCDHQKRLGGPAEFKSGVATCSDCGGKLTEKIPDFPQAPAPTPQFVNFETVYSAANISLVSMFKDILEQRGIKCWIKNEALSAGIGELPPIETWPQLCVEKDDYSEAKHIVEEALAAKDISIMWKCDSCGEVIEGQFTECWNCGKSRLGSGNAAAIHRPEEFLKNSNDHSDLIEGEERKQTLRGLRIFLLILSVFFFLVANFPLQPGQDPKKGLIGVAILLLIVLSFTYLPKGSK
jgi:putative signal transducing protein